MYKDRASLKLEIGPLDRKRINDTLDKHLEKFSPSTSKGMNGKDKDRFSIPSASTGKQPDQRPLSKNKCSDVTYNARRSCAAATDQLWGQGMRAESATVNDSVPEECV
ncbi:hypothetical protein Taro_007570 [Colocasia esculenta]|uniref:Uncharacterized protein n=1 Tax=Colocasia esculenta TaxID=4460 RepID=A0A843TRL7_COLES|nr:hypothetical protein [Colocasia esculenta]